MIEDPEGDIDASKAPLIEHLMELRERLIKALAAFVVMFISSFFFAKDIYNILVVPYTRAAGPEAKLIYTAPQEYFFTQIKVALFTAAFLACPVILSQIYAFVAPGLSRISFMSCIRFKMNRPTRYSLFSLFFSISRTEYIEAS